MDLIEFIIGVAIIFAIGWLYEALKEYQLWLPGERWIRGIRAQDEQPHPPPLPTEEEQHELDRLAHHLSEQKRYFDLARVALSQGDLKQCDQYQRVCRYHKLKWEGRL